MSSYTVGNYFESFIKEQVTVGRFNNASEVIREGLRLVEEREKKLQWLRAHLAEGVADLDAGRFVTPEQVRAEISQWDDE